MIQTTEEGILFADARYNTAGANSDKAGDIADLLASDYVDPDVQILHYIPKGMLLFNHVEVASMLKNIEETILAQLKIMQDTMTKAWQLTKQTVG